MNVRMELSQKQTQNLTLTQELSQSINILQYSTFELVDYLQQQVVENPVLEVKERRISTAGLHQTKNTANQKQVFDPILHYAKQQTSLEQHLMEQVIMLPDLDPPTEKMLTFLIGNINHFGYLEIEPAIAARIFDVSLSEMEQVIGILQSLDPIGVGTRNLTHCLLVQINKQRTAHPLAALIVKNHLDDLAAKNYRKIAKSLCVGIHEVQAAEDFIKTLNPRPCSDFNYEMTHYVAPDIIVKRLDDEYKIIVNDNLIPELRINQYYGLDTIEMDGANDFLKEKYHEAMILMNSLTQRNRTLLKVTQVIVEKQLDFLKKGLSGLKPMTLRDISEQLGYHESTISRATSNKYIQTPHGIYLLRSLFTTGLTTTNGLETESSTSVKEKIRALVDKEDKIKPYSDQQLVLVLEKDGILISRRTVAKYREEIGIPGSSKRKRF